jgi:UDP-N-acetylglucosamine 2-epimerase (non-hydrolysing)/GDP/UDP-N,N'-diacetylbacillosamine 2-epimerase (hydrolysing)
MLKAIADDSELELNILVTGMHLDPLHGETWREIEGDGFKIVEKVYGHVTGDTLSTMAASIGLYLYGMSTAFARIQPDIVLVLGDRGEMLSGAIAAAYLNIPIVHLCGGTVSGSIDDSIRHAITKFAHYHLVPFQESVERIVQMGEDPEHVLLVGLPGADLRPDVILSREEICQEYNLPFEKPYLLIVQHSVTQTQDQSAMQITETLEALVELGYPALLANPNDDAGGRVILEMMKSYAERYQNLIILPPPASRQKFASILAHAAALVGNSSSAVVEAMSLGVPVVNIGERQKGREHLSCWVNTEHEHTAIRNAILTALMDDTYHVRLAEFISRNVFDNETTNQKIIQVLCTLDLNIARTGKKFHHESISTSF